jgi:tetratricopeptide (TPR) repeat protein
MAVDVDHYAVLGIGRDATKAAVEGAVKKNMREWRKRTEAADLSVRQEAELRVKRIEEARAVLLDDNRRRAYDQQLTAGGVKQASPVPVGGGGGNWLSQAEDYLALGDYHSATYAAREATHSEGNNPRCWWIRSRANAGLGRLDDAIYEAQQAVSLDDSNAEFHFHLGCVAEEVGRMDQALNEFRSAARVDPSVPMYQLAIGGVYLQHDMPDRALEVVRPVYDRHPDDENANYYLGWTLIECAERVPAHRSGDTYMVTSPQEIDAMRSLASQVLHLRNLSGEVRGAAQNVLGYLDEMEKKTFRIPAAFGGLAAGGGAGFGMMLLAIGLPLVVLCCGFGVMDSSPGLGVLLVLASGGLGVLWFKMMYVPRWKANKSSL